MTESVLESHGPCRSLALSITQIGLETTELRYKSATGTDSRADRATDRPTDRSEEAFVSLSFGCVCVFFKRTAARDAEIARRGGDVFFIATERLFRRDVFIARRIGGAHSTRAW